MRSKASRRRLRLIGLMLPVLAAAAPVQAQDTEVARAFAARLEAARADLIAIRRDIHRFPEVSGEEERTARIVAEYLSEAGFDVRTGVGGHGVVGLLEGTAAGPTIAFRADMDAVRSVAADPVEFASEIPGVRHICGHDIHTTVGLALATGFSAVRDELVGSVMLIFQPAEETATGARAMLGDGVFDRRPDAILSVHTAPLEVGQVAIAPETQMPGRDAVRIEVRGEGDLEAAAQEARVLLQSVANIRGQQVAAPTADPFVMAQGVGATETSYGWRAIATLTTSSVEESRRAREALEAGIAALETEDIDFVLDYQERWIAGVTNSPSLVRRANESARAVLGENAVVELTTLVPAFSEDFGSFQDEVPGAMYFLGVSNAEKGWVGMPHTPGYVADEESIFVGANVIGTIVFDLFERGLP